MKYQKKYHNPGLFTRSRDAWLTRNELVKLMIKRILKRFWRWLTRRCRRCGNKGILTDSSVDKLWRGLCGNCLSWPGSRAARRLMKLTEKDK